MTAIVLSLLRGAAIVLFCWGAAPLSKIAQLQSPRAHSFHQSLSWPYIFVYWYQHVMCYLLLIATCRMLPTAQPQSKIAQLQSLRDHGFNPETQMKAVYICFSPNKIDCLSQSSPSLVKVTAVFFFSKIFFFLKNEFICVKEPQNAILVFSMKCTLHK